MTTRPQPPTSTRASPLSALLLACCFLGVPALVGCATTGSSNSASRSAASDELMTSYDMTDDRRRAIIRLQLAIGYMEREQYDVALDEIKRALAADPNYAATYNMRGYVYNKLDEKALAEESFRRSIALNPRDGDAQQNLGFFLCEQARYDEARQFFDTALANPTYQNKNKTQVAKAVCEMKAGNTDAAEAMLLSAYEEDARNPVAANALAELYYTRNDFRKAALYASQANMRNTATAASLWLATKIEYRLGNQSGVARYSRQLRESFPDSRELRLYERGAWNN